MDGTSFSENCLNKMSWYVNRKLTVCPRKNSSTVKRAFKVWDWADADSLCSDESLNDATEGEGTDSSQGEAVSISARGSDAVEFECEIRYCCADSESKDCGCNLKVVDLWDEARSIAYKISMLKGKSIKHFGYLVPANKIGWVKAGYYRSMPKAYKEKFKNEREKKSHQYYADHLEEKARKCAWFRFWWHPMIRFFDLCFIVLIALVLFSDGMTRLGEILVDRFDDLSSVDAGLFALFGIAVLSTRLIWQIGKAIKKFFLPQVC